MPSGGAGSSGTSNVLIPLELTASGNRIATLGEVPVRILQQHQPMELSVSRLNPIQTPAAATVHPVTQLVLIDASESVERLIPRSVRAGDARTTSGHANGGWEAR